MKRENKVKVCSKCKGDPKPAKEFYPDKTRKSGLSSRCKKCAISSNIENRRNRDRKQYERDYYLRNKDRHKARKERFLAKNPEWSKFDKIKRRYGLTREDFMAMLNKQEFKCAICKKHRDEERIEFCIDHCHKTGKVRGLLCNGCNNALGKFKDSLDIVKNAVTYLENHRTTVIYIDPPSGHRYGFPCEWDQEKETIEELLKRKGYPEKDYSLAMIYSRMWQEEVD